MHVYTEIQLWNTGLPTGLITGEFLHIIKPKVYSFIERALVMVPKSAFFSNKIVFLLRIAQEAHLLRTLIERLKLRTVNPSLHLCPLPVFIEQIPDFRTVAVITYVSAPKYILLVSLKKWYHLHSGVARICCIFLKVLLLKK